MPRDNQGLFQRPFRWTDDAAAKRPFSAERWDEFYDDYDSALNDLPLRSKVPTIVASGTSPASVNPGSIMFQSGKFYIRPLDDVAWLQIGPGVTDASAIVAEAVATVRAGVAANLDTFPELVALIQQQIAEADAGTTGLQLLAANTAAEARTAAGAAAASHSHAMSDVTGLQAALNAKADATSVPTVPKYTEGTTAPANPAIRDEWFRSDMQILYRRVQTSDPIWLQIG